MWSPLEGVKQAGFAVVKRRLAPESEFCHFGFHERFAHITTKVAGTCFYAFCDNNLHMKLFCAFSRAKKISAFYRFGRFWPSLEAQLRKMQRYLLQAWSDGRSVHPINRVVSITAERGSSLSTRTKGGWGSATGCERAWNDPEQPQWIRRIAKSQQRK